MKARWSHEEKHMVARKEAELLNEGQTNINLLLAQAFPSRSFDSIKSQRRRNSYKERVRYYQEQLARIREEPVNDPENDEDDGLSAEEVMALEGPNPNKILHEYFVALVPLPGTTPEAKELNSICRLAINQSWQEISISLGLLIRRLMPSEPARPVSKRPSATRPARSKKEKRRMEYARVQDLWRKDPSRCVQRILDDQVEQTDGVPQEIMEPY